MEGGTTITFVTDLKVEQVRAIEAPGVTHIKYRVVKDSNGRPTQGGGQLG